jgi:tetratricopeptide (TPR) repeat protein
VFQAIPPGSSNTGNNPSRMRMDMERRIAVLMMVALIALPGTITLMPGQAADALTIHTDKGHYTPGEGVRIYGEGARNADITIKVNSPLNTILNITVTADENGTYSYKFNLPHDSAPGVYTVTAIMGGEVAETNFTVFLTEVREIAESLIDMANRSRTLVEEAFQGLKDRNITVPPDAMASYNEGVRLLEGAQSQLDEGQYRAAMSLAFEALQRFTRALQRAHTIAPPPYEGLEELERATGLRVAIERANETLKRINSTLTSLRTYIVEEYSLFNQTLESAQGHLENATKMLNAGNVAGAANELALARGIIGRLTGLINSAAGRLKAMKALRFMEMTKEQVRKLEEKVLRLRVRLTEREMNACMEALRNVEAKLAMIRERLAQGDVEGALKELEEASDMIEKGIGNLERRELNLFLGEVNRLEARIRSLRNTIEALKKKGLNTSEAEEMLGRAEALLNNALSSMERGEDFGENREKLKEAEGLIEDAEDLLHGLTHPRGLGVRAGWPPAPRGKAKGR